MPPLRGHLSRALKGSGVEPEAVMEVLEKLPIMEQPVNEKSLVHGGSILGTVWNTLKSIFTSDADKNLIKTIAPKAVEGIANYGLSKLKGKEPEPKSKGNYQEYEPPRRVDSMSRKFRPIEEAYPEERYTPTFLDKTVGRLPGQMMEGVRERSRKGMNGYGLSGVKKGGSWTVKLEKN